MAKPSRTCSMAAAADLVIVAPLSANTLAKLALGLADNLLTATLLATRFARCSGPLGAGARNGIAHVGEPDDAGARGGARGARCRFTSGRAAAGWPRARWARGGWPSRSRSWRLRGSRSHAVGRWRAAVWWSLRAARRSRSTRCATSPMPRRARWGSRWPRPRATWAPTVTLVHAPLAVPVPSGVESVPVRTALEMCDAVLDACRRPIS